MQKSITSVLYAAIFSLPLLLMACRNNDEDLTQQQPVANILSHFNAEGKAWLTLDLSLSDEDGTTRGHEKGTTRATTFDDGTSAEHAIRTLTLVLFHGTGTEGQMQVASTYQVDYAAETDGHAQVTHHSQNTIQISSDNINANDRLAILAIANASPAISAGQTFADVRDLTADIITTISGTDYYMMSSSPLASANDGTGTVSTLVGITSDNLHPTEAEARSNPAGHIYLERAAAKVTVTNDITSYYIQGNHYATFNATDLTFTLDNYNASGYLCRHLSATNYARMVETMPLPNGKFRTYWAEDVNYDNLTTTLTNYTSATSTWLALGNDHPQYCAENTFDVSHMQDNYTTSVLVRLQLNAGTDFYTTSVTGQDIIFQPPSTTLSEEGTGASSSFSREAATTPDGSPSGTAATPGGSPSGISRSAVVTYDGTSTATIDNYLRTWLWQTNSAFRNWVNTYAAGEPKHVSIAVTTPTGGGTATATVTQTAQPSGSTGATAFASLALNEYIADNITLTFYDDGYCYYRVPVRHFNDTQTPWASAPTMTDNTTTQAYSTTAATAVGGSTADATFLGRYGMVRNNWYTIGITGVTHVGSPVIPSLTTDADDRIEQLLNATLNIASWTTNTGDL